jgi:tRNA(Leu) C34 or U34 (ribose-2'-O)-methylase TrmL
LKRSDSRSPRGFAAIGLDNPKHGVNVGAALRAAGCYGASLVVVGGRVQRFGRRPTDTSKAWRRIPLQRADNLRDAIPYGCVPVAVDLIEGAESLVDYRHPERAFYVFGAEDNTLGDRILSWCRDVVYVPTTACMNLAATVNVILYDRAAKALRLAREI